MLPFLLVFISVSLCLLVDEARLLRILSNKGKSTLLYEAVQGNQILLVLSLERIRTFSLRLTLYTVLFREWVDLIALLRGNFSITNLSDSIDDACCRLESTSMVRSI